MANMGELDNRFKYHPPLPPDESREAGRLPQPERYHSIREYGRAMAHYINANCPESEETKIAIKRIEEAVMWANAAIARNE